MNSPGFDIPFTWRTLDKKIGAGVMSRGFAVSG